ncbi:MAG: enoyl-CoA hydratase-related protein [Sporichthyaceae bacterium]
MEPVLIDDADGLRTIRLNRADAFNSLDLPAKQALLAAVREAAADDRVRAVLLTGSGRGFCVGQDLKEFQTMRGTGASPAELFETVAEHYSPISYTLATMDKPVVAAVNGAAAGAGLSLALAADLRIAAASATFTTAFTAIGLTPDTGLSWYLPRLVGRAKAAELLMLSPSLNAEQALELGLVNTVVADADLETAAGETAARLAAGPTAAYAAVRRLLRFADDNDLGATLAAEHAEIVAAGGTADHTEALSAFLDKRKPHFTGR